MRKLHFLLGALMLNCISYAQTIKMPTSEEINTTLNSETATWVNIINTIIGVVIFAGLIWVIHGIISKKEMSKAYVGSWVLALIIWTLANAFLIGS